MATLTLRPNSDSSVACTQFGTGTGNYGRVNEATADDTNGVVSPTGTLGSPVTSVDRYGLPDPSESGTINKITLYGRLKSVDTTYSATSLLVRVGTTNYTYAKSATSSYVLYDTALTTNPATSSAWTWANINDLVIGVSLIGVYYNFGTGKVPVYDYHRSYCSQLYVEVDYTPANNLWFMFFHR